MENICESSVSQQVTPCKSRKHLSTDAKEIVKNVYSTLMERGNVSKQAALEETATLTNIPTSTVWKIVNNPILVRKKRSDAGIFSRIDGSDQDIIRRKIYKIYEEQSVPTLDNLMKRLETDETVIKCSRTTLWKCIQHMGFKFKKINKRQVLMESKRIQEWRLEYLEKIRFYRDEQRPIIYLDETWFDTYDTPERGWVDSSDNCKTKAPSSRGKRITILHAGSKDGWIPNALSLSAKNIKDSSLDYHEDTTAELFENWFKNKLIPNIPPNSVIVMDNASYHSRQLIKAPCSNDTKATIQNYMYDNDIYFHEDYTKQQLIEVLKSLNIKKEYVCNNYAKDMGHTVLRFPPYHCIFNPIEHIWYQLKSAIRRNNICPTVNSSVLKLMETEVFNIPLQSWANSVIHVEKVEKSYIHIANNIEKLIISTNDNDRDSDIILSE